MKSKTKPSVRNPYYRRILLFWGVAITFIVLISFVADAFSEPLVKFDASKGEYRRRDEERVYIVGKIINIAYELQHRPSGAETQDALYSKGRQGLKTSGGRIWTLVDNIKGQQLQWDKQFLNKYVKILGWVYHDAQYIEVDSFTVEGHEFVWNKNRSTFEVKTETEMAGE